MLFRSGGLELRQWCGEAELGFRWSRSLAEDRVREGEGKQGRRKRRWRSTLSGREEGSGGRDDAGRRERPRGSLQREVGDEGVDILRTGPCPFSFSLFESFSYFFLL